MKITILQVSQAPFAAATYWVDNWKAPVELVSLDFIRVGPQALNKRCLYQHYELSGVEKNDIAKPEGLKADGHAAVIISQSVACLQG